MDMDGYASDIGMDHPGLLTFSLWHHDPPPGCFPDDAVNDLAKLLPRIISQECVTSALTQHSLTSQTLKHQRMNTKDTALEVNHRKA